MIAGASSGIEPLFAVVYVKNVMDGTELVEVNPYFKKSPSAKASTATTSCSRIAQKGTIEGFTEIPEKWRRIFVTSHDITPEFHIRMQAGFQQYTDNAVSKTVNFRREATPDDVREVFTLAYKLDCKGVTVYRDGSRDEQVLNIGTGGKKKRRLRPSPSRPCPA